MATQCDNLEPDSLRREGSVGITRQPGRDENGRTITQPGAIADEHGRVTRLWMPLVALELELWRCERSLLFW
jgi:hypothetical protein